MATTSSQRTAPRSGPSLTAPGLLLGVGLGGFIDGIVLHQVLQWHHLVSETERYGGRTVDDLRANVVADGLFHTATWLFVAAGIVALWRVAKTGSGPWPSRRLLGWMLVGWGAFNLVEGIVDHHLLQIHRVRPDAAQPLLWDLGFLALGAALVAGGWLLQRSADAHQRASDVRSERPAR